MYKPRLQITQIGTATFNENDCWEFKDWHFSSVYVNAENKPLNPIFSFLAKLLLKRPSGYRLNGTGLEKIAGWPLGTLLLVSTSLRKIYDKTLPAKNLD